MSTTVIHDVLSAELTAIPAWLRAAFKGHFNNTLCNGAMWMLVLWKIVHTLYTGLMHRYLKHIGTKQYIRTRLTNSLWYCGFFSWVLAYTLITFDGNKTDLFWGIHVTLDGNLPNQVILAYTAICSFYLHTALSEGIQCGSWHVCLKFILLVAVCISTFMFRVLEIPFSLSAVIATSAISEELTKIFHSLLKQDKFVGILYVFNIVFFIFIHLLVIPLIFLIPLGKMIRVDTSDGLLVLPFAFLLLWLCSAIYKSVVFNAIVHWLSHTTKESQQENISESEGDEVNNQTIQCPVTIIECSLFSMRTDPAYLMHVLRSEIRERKIKMNSKKKTNAKSLMLIQTLKCVMAIRKKLNQKKKSDNSDSDESSENENDTEDDNAAVCTSLHHEEEYEDDSESKLLMDEVKIENTKDATENLDLRVSENLTGESGTATDQIEVKTTASDFKGSLENQVLEKVEDSKEKSADIRASFESTPHHASDPKNSQNDQGNKLTCDGTNESLNAEIGVGGACATMHKFSESQSKARETQSKVRETSSKSISDKDKLDSGYAMMQTIQLGDEASLDVDNREESGEVKEEEN